MKKVFLFVVMLCAYQYAQAQNAIKFRFETTQLNDSISLLHVKAIFPKGMQLFSVKQISSDNPFKSSIQFDSSSNTLTRSTDSVQASANFQTDTAQGIFYTDSASFSYQIHHQTTEKIKGAFIWLAKSGDDFLNGEEKFSVSVTGTANNVSKNENDTANKSLWAVFVACFVAGLLAIITPCVFPLVPVTVSFFLKRSKSRAEGVRNAFWYSISIIFIYVLPTLVLVALFGDDVLYQISTSAIFNLLFFIIFIVFAISFFGAFEIQLPNSWANKADAQAGKGGLLGIFFMALTLVIVSFSCTGPIVGTLLGQTSSKGVSAAPIIGMLGFGVGLALPFSLFALFPSVLNSLPKSGGWLNSVKISFGFIELALAFKFLSNVDLIYHWRLLDRDVFLVLWIVIFGLMGIYLIGKLKFSHDSESKYISIPRLFFAVAIFSFSLYLIPGLWGAPLRHLSGFIPPDGTQDFNLEELKYKIGSGHATETNTSSNAQPPKTLTNKLHVPYGLTAYFTLEEGIAAAKALNKPVMIDFTGHSCANCRKMEKEVWKDEAVLKRIKENFVLISLYVDESTELPEAEQGLLNRDGDKIITHGDKNLNYQITKFGGNSQPLYMFLDTEGNPLSDVRYGYDPNVQKFIAHLDAAKAVFDKPKK